MNYNDRMSYVQRQERIEQQRRREAAAASNDKSNRTQVLRVRKLLSMRPSPIAGATESLHDCMTV